MKALLGLLVLLPCVTLAQGAVVRAPTATSGVSSVQALATCNTAADGRVVWLAPSNELQVCDGVSWRRVYTTREGVLPRADVDVPGNTFISQAAAGTVAFKSSFNAIWDFGNGVSDQCLSSGTRVDCGSWSFSDVSVDTIGTKTSGAKRLDVVAGGGLSVYPLTPLPTCNTAGTLFTLAGDSATYQCDGTTWRRIMRTLPPVTQALDFPSISNGADASLTVNVTGAVVGDEASCTPHTALPSMFVIETCAVFSSGVVTVTLDNTGPGPQDPASTTFTVRVKR